MPRADAGAVTSELSYQLEGLTPGDELVDAASAMLATVIPSDGVAWNHIDLVTGTAVLRGTPKELQSASVQTLLAAHAGDHPIIKSYLRPDDPGTGPRRMSDVASRRDLLRTGSYVEVMRPLRIQYQLSIMTTRSSLLTGSGWALSRQLSDFTDDDVAVAGAVQSVLSLMTQRRSAPAPPSDQQAERAGLTPREHEVLCLVAQGHTATRVGHTLRITPATVRKHLERVYAKLGVHDRLLAVQRGRALGLLGPP